MKYQGPCIDCGQFKEQQYILKRCIACYQKFHRYSQEFHPRKKYPGPCISCGTMESTSGRFVKKLCSTCISRLRKTGTTELRPSRKYLGPCIVCGSTIPGKTKSFQEKMCGKCYRHYIYVKTHPKMPPKYCIDCGQEISNRSKKERCLNCHTKYMRRINQNYKNRQYKIIQKYRKSKNGQETGRAHVRRRRAIIAEVENTLTQQEWQDILKKFDYKCAYCGTDEKIEMDHVIPISKGGPHTKNNVVPACRFCNASKGNRPIKA